uniref:Ig-like domain-containing protein n=1 Tax=Pseudomonas sp. RA_35y_Pfl2_P32 TaxID=3088705 RepID=UPI0030DB18C2
TLTFKAALDKSNKVENALVFPNQVYTIKAIELVTPTITSVKGLPSGANIANGAATRETTVVLSGNAANGQQVEVFDNKTPIGKATAHATTGNWTLTLTNLAVKYYAVTAKALYGGGEDSNTRTFNIGTAYRNLTDFDFYNNWYPNLPSRFSLMREDGNGILRHDRSGIIPSYELGIYKALIGLIQPATIRISLRYRITKLQGPAINKSYIYIYEVKARTVEVPTIINGAWHIVTIELDFPDLGGVSGLTIGNNVVLQSSDPSAIIYVDYDYILLEEI